MHHLERNAAIPGGLSSYRHGYHKWSGSCPTTAERASIWQALVAMQGERCAYCEGPISENSRHIEHFRQRGRYPQGTFDWHNLFGSCDRNGTCGDYKDKCGHYQHEDLIKPDVDEPDNFLIFTPLGAIRPRAGLSASDHHRAKETIRILKLDGPLNQIRRTEVAGYVQTAEIFAEMAMSFSESEWRPLLEEEIRNTMHLPYATAIRHVLTRQSDIE